MKNILLSLAFLITASAFSANSNLSEKKLKGLFKKYPKFDENKDGVLSVEEFSSNAARSIMAKLPGKRVHKRLMVPMRDGVKLATEAFVPEGKGPFPIVLCRTVYGRWYAGVSYVTHFKYDKVAYVLQDLRGDGDSEGKGTHNPLSFDNEINDSYDTVEWLAKQKWCDGKVGMIGGSGNAFSAFMAMLSKAPHLTVTDTRISGGNSHLYWLFHNGVRREMYNWATNRNVAISQWPRPTVELFDIEKYEKFVQKQSKKNKTVFIAKTGWYDIFAEGVLDTFGALCKNKKSFVIIDASGHGSLKGRKWKQGPIPQKMRLPNIIDVLKNKKLPPKSMLVYFLMGDAVDKKAPGNCWKVSNVWPVPNTPKSFYMKKDGTLSEKKSKEKKASLTFQYDPKNPVPSLGGDKYLKTPGPLDQRELGKRTDILRFVSEALKKPLEITGKVKAEIFVSSDVPDTTFTVKLIDIYPDGYEAIVRDSIIMGRFHKGFNSEHPMKKGKVYSLTLDMWSTALVFNKGHRIGVHISSSNNPKYEVHPNSFKPVDSLKDAPIANNTVHFSNEHPSRIILPVVK